MSEKDEVFSGKVKHSGIFDFKELYRFCYVWLVDKEYQVIEKEYTEKLGPTGKEVVIKWDAKRKISDYFRYVIKTEWRILNMKDAEVEMDGAKVTLNKGNTEIKAKAILEKDFESRWENSGFLKFLRGMYDKYLIRGRISDYEDKMLEEVDEYLAETKAFLALEGKH